MKLSERKRKILQLVVDDYISTAQPVSSKSRTENHMKDISSATVRSELAGLEEMGYLTQLHTSSGRVPSVEAYKLYVSELMDKGKLSKQELSMIKSSFNDHANNLEEVVENAVKVISELTDYTSVGYTSHSVKEKIEKIELFRHKENQALLLIVTDSTLIRDKFIDVPSEMTDEQIVQASRMVGNYFIGKELGEVISIGDKVKDEFSAFRKIFESVMSAIEDYAFKRKGEVVTAGESKILKHPEYNDSEKIRNFLSVVTSKERLSDLLSEESDEVEIKIKIGGEGREKMPDDCSLVTATYSISGEKIGSYGVIGPLRMDYQKVISVLEGVGKIIEDVIKNKK